MPQPQAFAIGERVHFSIAVRQETGFYRAEIVTGTIEEPVLHGEILKIRLDTPLYPATSHERRFVYVHHADVSKLHPDIRESLARRLTEENPDPYPPDHAR